MSFESVLLRRLVWNIVPAALVVGTLGASLAGENGLLSRHKLKARLAATEAQVVAVEVENADLRAEVRGLRGSPVALRRAAARTLLRAEPGSTLYRFEPEAP